MYVSSLRVSMMLPRAYQTARLPFLGWRQIPAKLPIINFHNSPIRLRAIMRRMTGHRSQNELISFLSCFFLFRHLHSLNDLPAYRPTNTCENEPTQQENDDCQVDLVYFASSVRSNPTTHHG